MNNPGYVPLSDLAGGTSFARGIYEEQDPIYLREQEEEVALLEVNNSVKFLLESLESKVSENNNEE
jgi:hypothetical protein